MILQLLEILKYYLLKSNYGLILIVIQTKLLKEDKIIFSG